MPEHYAGNITVNYDNKETEFEIPNGTWEEVSAYLKDLITAETSATSFVIVLSRT